MASTARARSPRTRSSWHLPATCARAPARRAVVYAGNTAAVPVGTPTDVAGLPRFFDDPGAPDTGAGTPPIVDMGAHERVPLSVSAPTSLALCAGSDAQFSVVAQGQPTLTYQWRKDTTPLSNGGRVSGADTDTLAISDTVPGDNGAYGGGPADRGGP